MNKGKKLLALSECADALCIVKEQARRASNLLASISTDGDEADSAEAARLSVAVTKYFEPLRVSIQRRHDELAREFVQEWAS